MFKRLFDIMFSLLALVVLSPVFIIVAILVKLDASGPAFYQGKRVGKNGRLFGMYKFRTMYADADKMG